MVSSELSYPHGRISVNLAQADLRNDCPAYDFPIAVALLILAAQIGSDLAGDLFVNLRPIMVQ